MMGAGQRRAPATMPARIRKQINQRLTAAERREVGGQVKLRGGIGKHLEISDRMFRSGTENGLR